MLEDVVDTYRIGMVAGVRGRSRGWGPVDRPPRIAIGGEGGLPRLIAPGGSCPFFARRRQMVAICSVVCAVVTFAYRSFISVCSSLMMSTIVISSIDDSSQSSRIQTG